MVKYLTGTIFMGRVFNAIIPILSWLLIPMPAWLSPFHPAVVAYFIIAFDLYFLYKSLSTTFHATLSYKEILSHMKINYAKKLINLTGVKDIKHFVIIPNFKEPLYKLEATINAIVESDYPFKNIYLILAFEKRETEVNNKALSLVRKYRQNFADLLVFFHPLLSNEV